uniref:Uncharacterized protein n=1 Tax=Knipowitschia caucasica TaxID=637954 RepID=A0AAV2JKW9_KNICA
MSERVRRGCVSTSLCPPGPQLLPQPSSCLMLLLLLRQCFTPERRRSTYLELRHVCWVPTPAPDSGVMAPPPVHRHLRGPSCPDTRRSSRDMTPPPPLETTLTCTLDLGALSPLPEQVHLISYADCDACLSLIKARTKLAPQLLMPNQLLSMCAG